MPIKETSGKYKIAPDTLRYFECVGAIPKVGRTSGRTRNYTDKDLRWIKNARCLKDAGGSVESIAEYVRLLSREIQR